MQAEIKTCTISILVYGDIEWEMMRTSIHSFALCKCENCIEIFRFIWYNTLKWSVFNEAYKL